MSNYQLPKELCRIFSSNLSYVDEVELVETIKQNVNQSLILDAFSNAIDNGHYSMPISPFELINIPIYDSSKLEVNINLFPKELNCQKATSLIHHHGPFRLYSYHLSGLGFDYFTLKKSRESVDRIVEGEHKDSSLYVVEPYDFHVLFGARSSTATLAIWIKDNSREFSNERQNLFVNNGKIRTISELKFSTILSEKLESPIAADKLSYAARLMIDTGIINSSELKSVLDFDSSKLAEEISSHLSVVNCLDHLSMGMTKSQIRTAFFNSASV